jgi:sugar lactone lactonase YvrE
MRRVWSMAGLVAVVLVGSASGAAAQGLFVTHLAGPKTGGAGTLDASALNAQFYSPSAVVVDADGNVLVADQQNNLIRRISTSGQVTTIAGASPSATTYADGPALSARFGKPTALASDPSGNLYIAEQMNRRIRKLSATGVVTTVAGDGMNRTLDGNGTAASFKGPLGIAYSTDGNLYVADGSGQTIRRITPSGAVTTLAGAAGSPGTADGPCADARFATPAGIAAAADGTLYVADLYNHAIRRIDLPACTVTTVAGLAGTPGTADGSGTSARFTGPRSIIVAASGLFVSDYGNNTIRQIDSDGNVTTLAGTAGTQGTTDGQGQAARFRGPAGLALDATGRLVVADQANNAIRRITAAGAVSLLAGTPTEIGGDDGTGTAARFNTPYGMAIDTSGSVFVADWLSHTVRRISSSGAVTTIAGQYGASGSADGQGSAARFRLPNGVAVDASGNLYIGDSGNHTIRKIAPDGTVTTMAGLAASAGSADGTGTAARFNSPYGLALGPDGNLYVADRENSTIRRITPAGEVTTFAGAAGTYDDPRDGTGADARFLNPEALAFDAQGNLYVADFGAGAIRRITPAGVVTTVGGILGQPGFVDGALGVGQINGPQGVAVDAGGNLYVADGNNASIRKIATDGTLSTLAGRYPIAGHHDGPAHRALLSAPTGIVVDARGRVIFADALSSAIRVVWRPAGPTRDFDGDGASDVAVYRPSTGSWFWLKSFERNGELGVQGWGLDASGDTPVLGDFDGDGSVDPTVFRPASGTRFVLESHASYTTWQWFGWGTATDVSMSGDYDGDGRSDGVVYRPSTGTWYIRPSGGAAQWQAAFGAADDVPVTGDFDGDGKADPAVYRPSTGTWFWLKSSTNFASYEFRGWGLQGDVPAPGDYDGDGKTDLCIFRPSTGSWFVLESHASYTTWSWLGWGQSGDELVPADYDGDGRTDVAVYRPSTRQWFVKPSSGASQWTVTFGQAGDVVLK